MEQKTKTDSLYEQIKWSGIVKNMITGVLV